MTEIIRINVKDLNLIKNSLNRCSIQLGVFKSLI